MKYYSFTFAACSMTALTPWGSGDKGSIKHHGNKKKKKRAGKGNQEFTGAAFNNSNTVE